MWCKMPLTDLKPKTTHWYLKAFHFKLLQDRQIQDPKFDGQKTFCFLAFQHVGVVITVGKSFSLSLNNYQAAILDREYVIPLRSRAIFCSPKRKHSSLKLESGLRYFRFFPLMNNLHLFLGIIKVILISGTRSQFILFAAFSDSNVCTCTRNTSLHLMREDLRIHCLL